MGPVDSYPSFIHSFIPAISIAPLQVLYYLEALPTTARILYRSFTPSAQATAGKGLAQGPYVAAKAGVEPTTLRLKVIVSTKAPSRPTKLVMQATGSMFESDNFSSKMDKFAHNLAANGNFVWINGNFGVND